MIADLQNQQAIAAAQNLAPTLALVPASAPTPRPSKVYVVKPPDFDNNNYEQNQILFVLLHIKGEHART
ncbi:hypothetical protein PNOK_0887100 [Pyrrhoderma noxium]|uniref:Uncharacterized protein n=1 Tax=Pyrrhoderma noxium TaxID=2282107 RepID=A0A286U8V0_9AGAM|nr:hypothetical protein PNOK_0887100 [Pyrrhoderma noxium]